MDLVKKISLLPQITPRVFKKLKQDIAENIKSYESNKNLYLLLKHIPQMKKIANIDEDFLKLKEHVQNPLLAYIISVIGGKEDVRPLIVNIDIFTPWIGEFLTSASIIPQQFKEWMKEVLQSYFAFSKEKREEFWVWLIAALWNNENLHNHRVWFELFDDFVVLFEEVLKRGTIEEAMRMHFAIYHVYGNNVQTIKEWRVFSEKIEKPASIFYKKWGEKNIDKKPLINKKKKIAFLLDRVVLNSPFMVFYSLVKELVNSDKEIYVYSMVYRKKQLDDSNLVEMLKQLGVHFYAPYHLVEGKGLNYSHLEIAMDLYRKIQEDEIDYLISGFGYDIPNFIFSNRAAPSQIFWSHGNCTSDVLNIDLCISHFEQECKEREWKIFNVPVAQEFLIGSAKEKELGIVLKKQLLEKYGKDTVILGTIGRLVKIDSDEYIKVIAKIIEQNPNTIYLACGAGNQESVREKTRKYGIPDERFIFMGHINPHVFGWVIDVWPDSFPLGQGQSKDEFVAKKRPVIHHIKRNLEITKETKDYIAENDEMYIKVVTDLIKNEKKRKELGEFEYKIKFKNKSTNFLEVIK